MQEKKNQPYEELSSELDNLSKAIPELLAGVNTFEVKQVIREKLQKAKDHIETFEKRLEKVSEPAVKKMVLTRLPEAGREFYTGSAALIISFKTIFKILRQEVVRSRDSQQIIDTLEAAKEKIPQLKILSEEIVQSLKPRKFNKRDAIDPYGAVGSTTDGVRISSVIRVTRGLGFETRSGGSHPVVIDLQDGMPCALAESTNFGRDVRSRMARASGRSSVEIEELLETV